MPYFGGGGELSYQGRASKKIYSEISIGLKSPQYLSQDNLRPIHLHDFNEIMKKRKQKLLFT